MNTPVKGHSESNGSPLPGEPLFLAVGKLHRPHGLYGEISMGILTDFPERLKEGKQVFIGEDHKPHKIKSVRQHQQNLLVTLEGIKDREKAGEYRNKIVSIKAEDLPELADDEYYHHQLLGLEVRDKGGNQLGILSDILETGANDVYVVKDNEGKELLLPAIEDVILTIDLAKNEMVVKPPDWYNE